MHRGAIKTAISLLCTVGFFACHLGDQPETDPAQSKTLQLNRLDNGNLEYCDETGECHEVPYNGECAVVEVDVNLETGATCERCILADGSSIDNGCSDVSVGCVVVTLPEPDCVVCAYVNGDIIFSSCLTAEPQCSSDMECLADDGMFGRCIEGQCIYEPFCRDNGDCPTGFFCRHDDATQHGMCIPFENECHSSQDCPEGMLCEMVCQSGCEPGELCAHEENCDQEGNCFPPEYCHGICVPAPPPPPECNSDIDCPADMICLTECWCADGTDPDENGELRDPNYCECRGVCVPDEPQDPCANLSEWECVERPECEPEYAMWDCICAPCENEDDPTCICDCPQPVEEYVGCHLAEPQDPCANLDEWECIQRQECEPEYIGWDCACAPCENEGDPNCFCDCPEPVEEYVGCHLAEPQGPCDNLSEMECIERRGCEPEYVFTTCACDCDPADPNCRCDCPEWQEYIGCREVNTNACEDLSYEECMYADECELIETQIGMPCYCEDCDDATGDCYCECPPQGYICVPREPEPECRVDEDCPEGMMCVVACWDCPPGDPACFGGCEGYCEPRNPNPCENLSEEQCIREPGCEPEYASWSCLCEPCPEGAQDCYCDCPEQEEYVGCFPGHSNRCEDLSIDECEHTDECMLVEYPCLCDTDNCDPATGECRCDCPEPMLACVPREEPPPPPACTSDQDCLSATGEMGQCLNGQCVFEQFYCQQSTDCPDGYFCSFTDCADGSTDCTDEGFWIGGICMPEDNCDDNGNCRP